jgi:hypothetical protein
MIFSMIALCRGARFVILAALLLAGWHSARADVRSNPYLHIPERNVFNLRPPPPPVAETNQVAATLPSKVILTGITSLFGPQVFLEITEQEPGKPPPTMPKRPILRAGDREGDIEVLSIDVDRSIVRIRNRSVESELTFEVPKSGGGGGGGGAAAGGGNLAANPPAVNPHGPPQGQPTIISSSEPRGGVTMLGGGGAFTGNSAGVTTFGGSTPLASGTSGGISSFGGLPPTGGPAYSSAANPALAAAGGLPNIPSRTMRTPSTTPPPQQQIDPEVQAAIMAAHQMNNEQINQANAGKRGAPQIPPLPIVRHLQENSGPPVPGGPPMPTPR